MKKNSKHKESIVEDLRIQKMDLRDRSHQYLLSNVRENKRFDPMPAELLTLLGCQFELRGSIYPMALSAEEEYHLPLSGVEHWVVCTEGEVEIHERQTQQRYAMSALQLLRISRHSSQEYPNLKVLSQNEPSRVLWIIGHRK
jgi:hypothetical protein